jgi:hypothetical protein
MVIIRVAAVAAVLLAGGAAEAAGARDNALFTTYQASATSVGYHVCGTVGANHQCFAEGTLSGFASACALIEGSPRTLDNVMTRAIYVLDRGVSTSDIVALYVFKRTDTFTPTSDTVTIIPTATVPLGMTGGASAQCFLAANNKSVYAATDARSQVVSIRKSNLGLGTEGNFGPGDHIASIAADDRGYVAFNATGVFFAVGPDGREAEEGGGNYFFVGSRNAMPYVSPMVWGRVAKAKAEGSRVVLDRTLFTDYRVQDIYVNLTVCGSLGPGSGCYSGASLGPAPGVGFDKVCGVLTSKPVVSGNVVSRDVYVLDKRANATDPAMLYVFSRTDTIANNYDTMHATLRKAIPLGWTAGAKARCFMAGNATMVYAATGTSPNTVAIRRSDLATTTLAGHGNVKAITADGNGHIAIRHATESEIIDPNGTTSPDSGDLGDTSSAIIFDGAQ